MLATVMNLGVETPSSPPRNSWQTDNHHMQSNKFKKRKAGRKKFQETRHPVYRGVRQRNGKWVCELRQPNKKSRVWVGTFSCPDMAARAYDVAAFALKGDSASLNFPQEVNALPRIQSPSSIRDIQCAAVEAAEAFAEVKESSRPPSSTLLYMEDVKMAPEASRKVVYMDEEELFNMPGLLDSMAEGLILTPPAMKRGFNWNDLEKQPVDFSLWSD